MRVFLTALAVTTLAGALPAHAADPEMHVASVAASPPSVSVTCDTSSYPAATYPCELVVEIGWDDCHEVATTSYGAGPCRLSVRGPLVAYPALDSSGSCGVYALAEYEPLDELGTLSFDSLRDPAFHVDTVASVDVLAGPARAGYNGATTTTQWIAVIDSGYLGISQPDTIQGVLTAGFGFSDLEWDCRTRAGGDPTSDPGVGGVLGPEGAFVFARTP